jgi:hypothetical protein
MPLRKAGKEPRRLAFQFVEIRVAHSRFDI